MTSMSFTLSLVPSITIRMVPLAQAVRAMRLFALTPRMGSALALASVKLGRDLNAEDRSDALLRGLCARRHEKIHLYLL